MTLGGGIWVGPGRAGIIRRGCRQRSSPASRTQTTGRGGHETVAVSLLRKT